MSAGPQCAERWSPGAGAFFEYHCLQSHASADAELWYRSRSPVTVLGLREDTDVGLANFDERAEAGHPLVYRVRFGDGHEADAFEDELLTGEAHYDPAFRPGERPR